MSAVHELGLGEQFYKQQAQQSLLSCWELPGTVTRLWHAGMAAPHPWPASLLQVALALIEPGESFAVHGENEEALAAYVASLTGARHRPAYAARWVLAYPYTKEFDVWSLPRIVSNTRRAMTLVVVCRLVVEPGLQAATGEAMESGIVLALRGPGIPWQRALIVDRTAADFLLLFAARQGDHPLGIDVVLVDAAGQVAALRRTTCCRPVGSPGGIMATPREKDAPLEVM